jgi:hypothetical protein
MKNGKNVASFKEKTSLKFYLNLEFLKKILQTFYKE